MDDLRAIDEWLTRERSPSVAVRTASAIRERAWFLANFPHGGRPYAKGTRVLPVRGTPYIIHYRLMGDLVEVLRLYHEREDWQVEP